MYSFAVRIGSASNTNSAMRVASASYYMVVAGARLPPIPPTVLTVIVLFVKCYNLHNFTRLPSKITQAL